MNHPLKRGSVVGFLGAGQLGKMGGEAASNLGYLTAFYCPDEKSCAFETASITACAEWDNRKMLRKFAGMCDVITTEFENVPIEVVDFLEKECGKTFMPSREALRVSQDRLFEKTLAKELGIPVPEFITLDESDYMLKAKGMPSEAILKTRRDGYDGKGQVRVHSPFELTTEFERRGKVPSIVEKRIDFRCEISVIVVRDKQGKMSFYEPFINTHKEGILDTTVWPSLKELGINIVATAINYTERLARKLDVVGLLAVEMFVLHDDTILFNEMAPRPHNSGHITRDCAVTSQFENHIRAITGHPIGCGDPIIAGKMVNIIGRHDVVYEALRNPNARVTLYGKAERDHRKLGHIVYFNR